MKRLLALIMTFFFAMNNNVAFQASDNSVYAPESYFRIEGNEAPDYRYMYENYTNIQTTGKCLGQSLNVSTGTSLLQVEENGIKGPYKYWFDSSDHSMKVEGLSAFGNTYTFEGTAYIVAPQDCIVETTSSDGGGHSMKLTTTDGKYTIYVQGMERWFCCRRRSTPDGVDPAEYTWIHTINTYGYKIPRGYMIGIATQGTTVTVERANGVSISTMTEFYKE